MRVFSLLLTLIVLLAAPVIRAQEEVEPSPLLEYGQIVTGTITNNIPRAEYRFEGLRCETVAIHVRPISGNLDPTLLIMGEDGTILARRDDTAGSLESSIEVRIPVSGPYTMIVSRFGFSLGSTSGGYELSIERIGNGSASFCALRYGDTVQNTISDQEPQVFYSFRARQGDIINLTMRRLTGNLDPYVQVVDNQQLLIAESDDTFGSLDAQIDGLLIPADGTYFIVATRYGAAAGPSSGNFTLSLEEAANSGLGNTAQAAAPIAIGSIVEGSITTETFNRYYRFEARQDDIITIRMERIDGDLDAYLILTNASLQELAANDDSAGSRNSLIEDFMIPADGTYYIIASRFEREAGASTGRYRLELEDRGNAFDEVPLNVPRLQYGTSITGSIDEVTPEGLYAFFGSEGDVVTISATRVDGDLDTLLTLSDAAGDVLAENDDVAGTQDSRIELFTLDATGIYYVRVERSEAAPAGRGGYLLVLVRRVTEEG
jgi:hypothetical protein